MAIAVGTGGSSNAAAGEGESTEAGAPDHERLAASYVEARGIPTTDAQKARMYPVESATEVHSRFRNAPALVIPYIDPWTGLAVTYSEGGGLREFQRIRYLPSEAAKGFVLNPKPQRYAQPKGSPVFAYFAPGGFIDWPLVLSDTTLPVVITEGEIKGLSACKHGIPAIALGGVYNFQNDGVLLPELDRIIWRNRKTIICFDSDIVDKPEVQKAERRLTRALRKLGAIVHHARLLPGDDGSKMGLDDFIAAVGFEKASELLLSALEAPEFEIELAPERLNENLEELDEALVNSRLPIFQRSGQVVHIVDAGELTRGEEVRRAADAPIIREASTVAIQQLGMRATKFVKWNERKKKLQQAECPRQLGEHYIYKVGGWRLPNLQGVVEAPTIRPDGTILQASGYDAKSGLFYQPRVHFPLIPESPSRSDALTSLAKLRKIVRGFEFASSDAELVWVAAAMTAVIRRSLRTAPLFAISAPVMGAGKTLAADLVSIIATGHEPAVMSQGRSPEEDRKRLLSVLMRGDAVIQIDNCEVPIEGDALCIILTSPEYQDRVLGRSEMIKVPTNATFLATGNNITFRGDMSTRAIMCKIRPKVERPDERTYDWDARDEARVHRVELVAAALTIIRAYIAAGSPNLNVRPFGRFEEWERYVRHPLLWLDAADPCNTRELVEQNDPERETFERLLHLWKAVFNTRPVRVKEIVDLQLNRVGLPPEARELYDLASEISGGKGRDLFDAAAFGKYLATKEERLVGEYQLTKGKDRKSKTATWQLRGKE